MKGAPEKGQLAIQTIILADDDQDDHLIFADALHEIDPSIKLTTVKDGNELLSLLRNYIPDMVFLDLDMPGKNGLECLKSIRSNEHVRDLPVVVYSSTQRQNNISVAYEMGADLFFSKPSAYNELITAIRAMTLLDWSQREELKKQFMSEGNYIAFAAERISNERTGNDI